MGSEEIEFSLPNDGWVVGEPPTGAIFFARRVEEYRLFVPNILVSSGELVDERTLADAADSLFEQSQAVGKNAKVVKRGEPQPGQLMQEVTFLLRLDEEWFSVTQYQVLLELQSVTDDRRGLLLFSLAACSDEIQSYVDDFQAFVGSATVVSSE